MPRKLLLLVLGACACSAALAQTRPPIPGVVLDHMNDLDRRCVAAGGRAGEGRFVVAQDLGKPGAVPPAVAPTAPASGTPVAGAAEGPAPTPLAVPPEARARFLAECRQTYVSRSADAARWADEQCVADWGKVTDSAAATDALLAALPASAGEAVPLATLRQRLSGVRWAAKPRSRELSASGRLGKLEVSVTGAPAAKTLGMNWMEVGAEPPYDIIGALRVRGVTLTEIACEEFGAGEWQRVFSGSAPGRAPFRLELAQRIAPFANSNSYYAATIDLSGRAPAPPASRSVCSNPSNLL
ncbi:MAG: hypothetical protein ACYCWL_04235 [Thauera sp.]